MKTRLFLLILIPFLMTAGCNFTLDVGMEDSDTTQGETGLVPGITPTEATIPPATPTPVVPTNTPSPTPLPGTVVYPAESLGTDMPWLPLDRTKWPAVLVVIFNFNLPPFNNPLVRQAFAASIDRDAIVAMADKYYAVDPSKATTLTPPKTLGRDLTGEVGINYDPERAKELFTQAGYADASAFPRITLIVASYGDTAPGARYNMAKAMADMWLNTLGVTVEVQALERAAYRERIKSNLPELTWIGWIPDENDPNFIMTYYQTNSEYNYGHYSNPDYDALIDQAAAIHDPAERQLLYIEAERLLCETDTAIMPLYFTFSNIP